MNRRGRYNIANFGPLPALRPGCQLGAVNVSTQAKALALSRRQLQFNQWIPIHPIPSSAT